MRLKLSGGSDDIIETVFYNGTKTVRDEIYLKSEIGHGGSPGYDIMTLKVTSVGGAIGCKVYAIYDGYWTFAPSSLDVDVSMPDGWTFTLDREHDYSASLTIEADEVLVLDYKGKNKNDER